MALMHQLGLQTTRRVLTVSSTPLNPRAFLAQAVPPVYDLFAISQHYGSLGGGHYTATCEYEGQGWYAFNDSGVSRAEAMDPADSARSAYVLFYRRQQDLCANPSELTALLLDMPLRQNIVQRGCVPDRLCRICAGVSPAAGCALQPGQVDH